MTVLEINRVMKRFADQTVLSNIDFHVAAGECIALLGHNGAGKTTLMRIVLGLLRPDHGTVKIFGHTAGSLCAQKITAYLPESVSFHRLLTGREQLRAFARLWGETAGSADDLLGRVGLAKAADRRTGTYSKGMRQRLGLAQALLGNPQLVLLDEPTSGLDPIARAEFYDIIRELAARGAAVLVSTHALNEIAPYSNRIVMLREGERIADGSLETLRRLADLPVKLRLVARDGEIAGLQAIFGGVRINGRSMEFTCPPGGKLSAISEIGANRDRIEDIEILAPSLDDLYRHFSRTEI